MEKNIFEKATREKTRFNFKGSISVEDLWDLSPGNLDTMYGQIQTELERLPKVSLIGSSSKQRNELEFKQEIIKYVFETKKAESEVAEKAKENSAKKQMILDILAKKQNESYENMSVEELKVLAESL